MRRLHVLPRLLLNLSYQFRLGLVLVAFLLSTLLFALGFPGQLNGSLLGIPIALAVWLFKRRGALLSITSTVLVIMLVNSITIHSIAWPSSLLTSFTAGVFALLAEALIIGYLRHALDISDAARLQAQQAEEQLRRAVEQQQQLNRLKDQLLVHINHELRTPLTGALGYLELLQDFGTSLDAATSSTFLRNAYRNCLELQLLVTTVLDALNTQQKDALPAPERVPVLPVVQEVLEQFDPRVKAGHPLVLDIPEQLTVCAHRHSLHQVLRNLLSNAFTYAPMASPVTISATPYVSDTSSGEAMLMCVKDVGPGIPPEELPLLFGQFVRLKRDMGGAVRGTGLGLYVSKQLVQAMGGTIWVESAGVAGQGSRFCVILPTVSPHMLSLPALATDHELSLLSRDKPSLEECT